MVKCTYIRTNNYEQMLVKFILSKVHTFDHKLHEMMKYKQTGFQHTHVLNENELGLMNISSLNI